MNTKNCMKRHICTLLVFFTMCISTAYGGLSAQETTTHSSESVIATLPLLHSDTFSILGRHDITVLTVDASCDAVVVQVSLEELSWLSSKGFSPKIVSDELAIQKGWKSGSDSGRDFHTYAQMTAELQTIATTYPEITRLYDLGHSVQGRTIWGLKVTDNPDEEEDEPEVRICGVHHGDEYMSGELPLLLAQYLTQNYETNTTVETLVDSREIWVIPFVNPDGHELDTRQNANGVDLNRDYGYMWGEWSGSPSPFSQPETQIIRQNALENNFVLSLSFHCSGDVVNYIWNYKHERSPDNAVTEYLSDQYGSHNGYWVVEGFDWYQTMGDTNDFSYGCRGDIDWTIEVQSSDIPQCWQKNREAMFDIITGANLGLRGIVTDAQNGQPVTATVWVQEAYWPCFTDHIVGDYHKPLLPGTYHVTVTANGYQSQTFSVDVETGEPTVYDVELNRANEYYAYQITTAVYYAPSDDFTNNPTEAIAALGPEDNSCASLGVNGYIIIDMYNNITDKPDGSDFKVYEGDATQDGYTLYGSANWNGPWTNLGTGMGTTEFDLSTSSLDTVRYLKIVDDGTGSASEMYPGCDIDAIENLAAADANQPPNNPAQPNGPGSGAINVPYSYTTSTSDPESQQVYYQWSWGDSVSAWLGPYDSGATAQQTHSWSDAGDYTVKVKAKDTGGAESGWSASRIVHIASAPVIEIGEISGGFGITADINNSGAVEANNVNWSISLQGGLVILGRQTSGVLPKIQPGFSPQIKSGFIFGIGSVTILVTANDIQKTASGFVFGPFVIIKD